jgi:hypothetical protein
MCTTEGSFTIVINNDLVIVRSSKTKLGRVVPQKKEQVKVNIQKLMVNITM